MSYFSNAPAPSVGSELPMPRSTKEVIKEIKSERTSKRRNHDPSDESNGETIVPDWEIL